MLSYCLGHNQFVSSIQLIDCKTLISGSGDGKIIIWDFAQGNNLFTFNFDSNLAESNVSKDSGKEKSQYPIKSISTDQEKANYLAVSFYKQPLICVLKVIRDGENASSLELVDKIVLEAEPVWMQFDSTHCNFLWVLSGSKKKPIEMFELKQDKMEKAFETLKVVNSLNDNQQLSVTVENALKQNLVDGLFKHYFNNVEMYYQRKMLRIENENNKTNKRFI